jgi:hypothetical protein
MFSVVYSESHGALCEDKMLFLPLMQLISVDFQCLENRLTLDRLFGLHGARKSAQ